jgi:hypothetical protein
MKVKVLRPFIDSEKNEIHPVGKIIEVSEERFEVISAVEGDPLVEKVESKTRKTNKEVD